MKENYAFFIVAIFCAASFSSGAATHKGQLNGSYLLKKGPFKVDPDPADKIPRVYMVVKGAGAADMYEAMQGEARNDFCGDKNAWVKQAGNVMCFRKKKSFECVFSLNLKNGKSESAAAC